jgi:hypothetical protein
MSQIKKCTFLLMLLSVISYVAIAQSNYRPYKVYIKEEGLKSISKEEFLKLDNITVEPKNYYYFTFTIIVAGCGKPIQYVMTKGTKIDSKVKEWVMERDSCTISLDEIKVYNNGYWVIPPIVFSVK